MLETMGALATVLVTTKRIGKKLPWDCKTGTTCTSGGVSARRSHRHQPGEVAWSWWAFSWCWRWAWQRCVVNGQTVFSPTACPSPGRGGAGSEHLTAPATRSAPQAASGSITLYHCKAYNGGTFWANTHCNQHQALIDRMVEVPARLAFSQQVEMAEGGRRSAAALQSAPPAVFQAPVVSNRGACDALAQQIQHWDALARQPQSAQTQDWIRVERHKTRDRQWSLRC